MTEEHLARFTTKDGKHIDMFRENGDVLIKTQEHNLAIPRATGQQTLDWIALFEGLSEQVEYLEGDD